jgi:cyclophilin family peptidyl-prolyl cis-trans isomerase
VRVAFALILAALALVATGCGGSDEPDDTVTSTETVGTEIPEATDTAGSGATSFSEPQQVLQDGKQYTIVMTTSQGVIRIRLDPAAGGPIPNSIAFLVEQGFYDGLTFHRVVPDFVLQGGDPSGDGSGGPGYSVVGPVPDDYGPYKIGDVAMAKTAAEAPGTAGSQFFVISGQQGATLPPDYGILGHAYDPASLATIEAIAALAVTDGPPSEEVTITKATVEEV